MQESSMELLWRSSHIAGGNATYVEDLYESYLTDANSVPEQWRDYFNKLPRVESSAHQVQTLTQFWTTRSASFAATASRIASASAPRA